MSTRRWPVRPAAGDERGRIPLRNLSGELRLGLGARVRALCSADLHPWQKKNARGGRSRPSPAVRSPSLAEQILLHARRAEDEVARLLELAAQPPQIDVEQLALPLAHLAGHDHGLDIAALHHLHDSTRYVVDREYVDVRAVEDDDIGLLARLERTGLAV